MMLVIAVTFVPVANFHAGWVQLRIKFPPETVLVMDSGVGAPPPGTCKLPEPARNEPAFPRARL